MLAVLDIDTERAYLTIDCAAPGSDLGSRSFTDEAVGAVVAGVAAVRAWAGVLAAPAVLIARSTLPQAAIAAFDPAVAVAEAAIAAGYSGSDATVYLPAGHNASLSFSAPPLLAALHGSLFLSQEQARWLQSFRVPVRTQGGHLPAASLFGLPATDASFASSSHGSISGSGTSSSVASGSGHYGGSRFSRGAVALSEAVSSGAAAASYDYAGEAYDGGAAAQAWYWHHDIGSRSSDSASAVAATVAAGAAASGSPPSYLVGGAADGSFAETAAGYFTRHAFPATISAAQSSAQSSAQQLEQYALHFSGVGAPSFRIAVPPLHDSALRSARGQGSSSTPRMPGVTGLSSLSLGSITGVAELASLSRAGTCWHLPGVFVHVTALVVTVQALARWLLQGSSRLLAPPDTWFVPAASGALDWSPHAPVDASPRGVIAAAWSVTTPGAGRLLRQVRGLLRLAVVDTARAAFLITPSLILGCELLLGSSRLLLSAVPRLLWHATGGLVLAALWDALAARGAVHAVSGSAASAVSAVASALAAAAALPLRFPALAALLAAVRALVDLAVSLGALLLARPAAAALAGAAALAAATLPSIATAPSVSASLLLLNWLPLLGTAWLLALPTSLAVGFALAVMAGVERAVTAVMMTRRLPAKDAAAGADAVPSVLLPALASALSDATGVPAGAAPADDPSPFAQLTAAGGSGGFAGSGGAVDAALRAAALAGAGSVPAAAAAAATLRARIAAAALSADRPGSLASFLLSYPVPPPEVMFGVGAAAGAGSGSAGAGIVGGGGGGALGGTGRTMRLTGALGSTGALAAGGVSSFAATAAGGGFAAAATPSRNTTRSAVAAAAGFVDPVATGAAGANAGGASGLRDVALRPGAVPVGSDNAAMRVVGGGGAWAAGAGAYGGVCVRYHPPPWRVLARFEAELRKVLAADAATNGGTVGASAAGSGRADDARGLLDRLPIVGDVLSALRTISNPAAALLPGSAAASSDGRGLPGSLSRREVEGGVGQGAVAGALAGPLRVLSRGTAATDARWVASEEQISRALDATAAALRDRVVAAGPEPYSTRQPLLSVSPKQTAALAAWQRRLVAGEFAAYAGDAALVGGAAAPASAVAASMLTGGVVNAVPPFLAPPEPIAVPGLSDVSEPGPLAGLPVPPGDPDGSIGGATRAWLVAAGGQRARAARQYSALAAALAARGVDVGYCAAPQAQAALAVRAPLGAGSDAAAQAQAGRLRGALAAQAAYGYSGAGAGTGLGAAAGVGGMGVGVAAGQGQGQGQSLSLWLWNPETDGASVTLLGGALAPPLRMAVDAVARPSSAPAPLRIGVTPSLHLHHPLRPPCTRMPDDDAPDAYRGYARDAAARTAIAASADVIEGAGAAARCRVGASQADVSALAAAAAACGGGVPSVAAGGAAVASPDFALLERPGSDRERGAGAGAGAAAGVDRGLGLGLGIGQDGGALGLGDEEDEAALLRATGAADAAAAARAASSRPADFMRHLALAPGGTGGGPALDGPSPTGRSPLALAAAVVLGWAVSGRATARAARRAGGGGGAAAAAVGAGVAGAGADAGETVVAAALAVLAGAEEDAAAAVASKAVVEAAVAALRTLDGQRAVSALPQVGNGGAAGDAGALVAALTSSREAAVTQQKRLLAAPHMAVALPPQPHASARLVMALTRRLRRSLLHAGFASPSRVALTATAASPEARAWSRFVQERALAAARRAGAAASCPVADAFLLSGGTPVKPLPGHGAGAGGGRCTVALLSPAERAVLYADASGNAAASLVWAATAIVDATTVALNAAALATGLPQAASAAEAYRQDEMRLQYMDAAPPAAAAAAAAGGAGNAAAGSQAAVDPLRPVAAPAPLLANKRLTGVSALAALAWAPVAPFYAALQALLRLLLVAPASTAASSLRSAATWLGERFADALAGQLRPYDPLAEARAWVRGAATLGVAHGNRSGVILDSIAPAVMLTMNAQDPRAAAEAVAAAGGAGARLASVRESVAASLQIPETGTAGLAGASAAAAADPLLAAASVQLWQLAGVVPTESSFAEAAARRITSTLAPLGAVERAARDAAASARVAQLAAARGGATGGPLDAREGDIAAAAGRQPLSLDDARPAPGGAGAGAGAGAHGAGEHVGELTRVYVLPHHSRRAVLVAVAVVAIPLTLALLYSAYVEPAFAAAANAAAASWGGASVDAAAASAAALAASYADDDTWDGDGDLDGAAAAAVTGALDAAAAAASASSVSPQFSLLRLCMSLVRRTHRRIAHGGALLLASALAHWRFAAASSVVAVATLIAWALLAAVGAVVIRVRIMPGDEPFASASMADLAMRAALDRCAAQPRASGRTVPAGAGDAHLLPENAERPAGPGGLFAASTVGALTAELGAAVFLAQRRFPRIERDEEASAPSASAYGERVVLLLAQAASAALGIAVAGPATAAVAALLVALSWLGTALRALRSALRLRLPRALLSLWHGSVFGARVLLWAVGFAARFAGALASWAVAYVVNASAIALGTRPVPRAPANGSSNDDKDAPPSLSKRLLQEFKASGSSNPLNLLAPGSATLPLFVRSPAAQTAALLENVRAVTAAVELLADALAAAPAEDVHSVMTPLAATVVASLLSCLASLGSYLSSPRYIAAQSLWVGSSLPVEVAGAAFLPATAWGDAAAPFAAAHLVELRTDAAAAAAGVAAGAAAGGVPVSAAVASTLGRLRSSVMLLHDAAEASDSLGYSAEGQTQVQGQGQGQGKERPPAVGRALAGLPAPRHMRPAAAALHASLLTALRRIRAASPRAFDEGIVPALPSPLLYELARSLPL